MECHEAHICTCILTVCVCVCVCVFELFCGDREDGGCLWLLGVVPVAFHMTLSNSTGEGNVEKDRKNKTKQRNTILIAS